MIERQVAGVASDLQEARRQYERTRKPDYLEFIELRASGLLEDNKMLTSATRTWLTEYFLLPMRQNISKPFPNYKREIRL